MGVEEQFAFSFTSRKTSRPAGEKGPKWESDRPENSISAESARNMERQFIDRTRENIETLGEIKNPLENRIMNFDFEKKQYHSFADRSLVKEIMEHYEIYDKALLKRVPENSRFQYMIREKGFLSSKEKIHVAGVFLSHLEGFITRGYSNTKVPLSEIENIKDKYTGSGKIFTYLGIMSPTGFEDNCYESIPDGASFEIGLVEPWKTGGFRITNPEKENSPWMRAIFDIETREEKIYRVEKFIRESDELSLPGGFIMLTDAAEDLGLPQAMVEEICKAASKADETLSFEEVGGKLIIKRARI